MKKNNEIAMFVMIFIGAIVGIAFLMQIADNVSVQTNELNVVNETINIASARGEGGITINQSKNLTVANGFSRTGNPISNFVLKNQTGYVLNTGNYTVDLATGNFTLTNTTNTAVLSNTTLVSYTYQDTNYIDSAPARSITGLIVLLCALAIVLYVIGRFVGIDNVKKMLGIGSKLESN